MAKKGVVIAGKFFEQELFDYLLTTFKDSFAHTSLTIESAFKELDECEKLYISSDILLTL